MDTKTKSEPKVEKNGTVMKEEIHFGKINLNIYNAEKLETGDAETGNWTPEKNNVGNQMAEDYDADEGETFRQSFSSQPDSHQLPTAILILLFVEKFLEIVVVFLLTLLAILWETINCFVTYLLWPLIGYVLASVIVLTIFYRVQWFRRSPGFLLFKLCYLLFLIAVFLLLAIHVPRPLTFLYPYFALVAEASIALTYIFFAFITITHKHLCKVHANGCSLMALTVTVPIAILLVNQPLYMYGGISYSHNYWDFMVNIAVGIVTSLPFSCETVYIYKKFINAKGTFEFINTTGLLPGFATVYFSTKESNNGKPGCIQN